MMKLEWEKMWHSSLQNSAANKTDFYILWWWSIHFQTEKTVVSVVVWWTESCSFHFMCTTLYSVYRCWLDDSKILFLCTAAFLVKNSACGERSTVLLGEHLLILKNTGWGRQAVRGSLQDEGDWHLVRSKGPTDR